VLPCTTSPVLPSQGGIVPILWQPLKPTNTTPTFGSENDYTLIVAATEDISVGVIFRFQTWDGLNTTYDDAGTTLATFDLTVTQKIPAGTKVVVSMTTSGTLLYGQDSTTVFSAPGKLVPATNFTQWASMIAFAFVPTPSGVPGPIAGQPQFAIGFSYNVALQDGCVLTPSPFVPASATAPNFPGQFSGAVYEWIFLYQVVYPAIVNYPSETPTCRPTYGIKFQYDILNPTYVTGSWSNLRQVVSQPQTIISTVAYTPTVNNWVPYSTSTGPINLPPTNTTSAQTGPFTYVLAEGQLAVVYFAPSPAVYPSLTTRQLSAPGPAQIAFVVTAPIKSGTVVYGTLQGYDSATRTYAPAVSINPSFTWTVGAYDLPAGTVILMTGIGSLSITVQDAHGIIPNVGLVLVSYMTTQYVVSIILLATWIPGATQRFITAALSNQYVGDFPELSPCLTIAPAPFALPSIYGQGLIIDNMGLPGTVQSPMINSGAFVTLPYGTLVPPTSLPVFRNMANFSY